MVMLKGLFEIDGGEVCMRPIRDLCSTFAKGFLNIPNVHYLREKIVMNAVLHDSELTC